MKIHFSSLIKSEIDYINAMAAWTGDQAAIFEMLLSGKLTDTGIMHRLSMSGSRYYRNKREIRQKIDRILREKG